MESIIPAFRKRTKIRLLRRMLCYFLSCARESNQRGALRSLWIAAGSQSLRNGFVAAIGAHSSGGIVMLFAKMWIIE